jgi:hypothetical protein
VAVEDLLGQDGGALDGEKSNIELFRVVGRHDGGGGCGRVGSRRVDVTGEKAESREEGCK